jgi:hypothetical protein
LLADQAAPLWQTVNAQAMKALESTMPQFALLSPDFTFVVILNTVSSRVTEIFVHS